MPVRLTSSEDEQDEGCQVHASRSTHERSFSVSECAVPIPPEPMLKRIVPTPMTFPKQVTLVQPSPIMSCSGTQAPNNEAAWLASINRIAGRVDHYFKTTPPDAMAALEKRLLHVEAALNVSTDKIQSMQTQIAKTSRRIVIVTLRTINPTSELNLCEQQLEDAQYYEAVVTQLSRLGGTDLRDFLRRILSSVFNVTSSKQLNWSGHHGKHQASKFKITKAITDAVHNSHFAAATDKEVDSIIALLLSVIDGRHIKTQSTPTSPAPEKFRVGDNFRRWERQAKEYVFLFTQEERARVLATLLDGEALDIAIDESTLQGDITEGTFRRLRTCFTIDLSRLKVCGQFHGRIQHPRRNPQLLSKNYGAYEPKASETRVGTNAIRKPGPTSNLPKSATTSKLTYKTRGRWNQLGNPLSLGTLAETSNAKNVPYFQDGPTYLRRIVVPISTVTTVLRRLHKELGHSGQNEAEEAARRWF
ncbi:hypothetical protein EG68_06144 [Paragonimus skrjabini miyazakii]|uniref:DUF4806 domain-containing protein n=1 Tax=Paragonimus skrjabini miyazakii TaxID=59628 RepID=A0A8S9YXR9_9TREM|nr:hypothetical protein EG68_06144 [Paragonimus skrjabini miyazakii]